MKKRNFAFAVIVLVVMALVTLSGTVLAKGPGSGDHDGVRAPIGDANGPANGFIDEDGDGVNDRFVDADGDGVCDGLGTGECEGVTQLRDQIRLRTCTPQQASLRTRDQIRLRTCTPEQTSLQTRDQIRLRTCTPVPQGTQKRSGRV